jgi:hypothetical protein
MTTATFPSPALLAPKQARRLLAVMIFLSVVSFALVMAFAVRHPPDPDDNECRGFAIGVSAIGGPDCIGGRSLP